MSRLGPQRGRQMATGTAIPPKATTPPPPPPAQGAGQAWTEIAELRARIAQLEREIDGLRHSHREVVDGMSRANNALRVQVGLLEAALLAQPERDA